MRWFPHERKSRREILDDDGIPNIAKVDIHLGDQWLGTDGLVHYINAIGAPTEESPWIVIYVLCNQTFHYETGGIPVMDPYTCITCLGRRNG